MYEGLIDLGVRMTSSPRKLSRLTLTVQVPVRKPPSSDLEPDTESDSFSLTTTTDTSDRSDRSRTPPKCMRREGSYDHSASLPLSPSVTSTTSASVPPPSSSPLSHRQRKRSSEELEVDDSPILGKRMRGDGEPRTPSVKGVELELEPRTRIFHQTCRRRRLPPGGVITWRADIVSVLYQMILS